MRRRQQPPVYERYTLTVVEVGLPEAGRRHSGRSDSQPMAIMIDFKESYLILVVMRYVFYEGSVFPVNISYYP
jgi:hypothetical protein